MPPASTTLDPRTPVLVAVGQVEQRVTEPTDALEPTALLASAVRAAVADSASPRLLDAVDTVAVIRILSHHYADPGALVAQELGLGDVRTIATDDGGNYPQSLLNRACREIAAGASDGWIIGGAETWRSRQAAHARGVALGWTTQPDDTEPTESVANHLPLFHPDELARGVILPATVYALFGNAFRAARGWSIDEDRDRIAQLYASFSEVAAANPHAWIREPWSAARIREAAPDNRMIGFPYTKVMNANNAVEQAACVVITSVERARAAGISTDRWVFPWAGADAHEHWFVSNRWSLGAAPAVGLAGRAALDLAGVGVDDLGLIDVYSCFPSAVEIASHELGLPLDDPSRPLTVTGGLSFAGGPWNDYVTHSIATMAERLRDQPEAVGLVTANGGYLTKHAMGIYSATPPTTGFRHRSVQPEVDALPSREVAPTHDGPVTVESAVVMHGRSGTPEAATVAVLLDDGRRAWGSTSGADEMARFLSEETAGASGRLDPSGRFEFA